MNLLSFLLELPKISADPETNLIDTIKRATPVAYDIGKLLHPIRLLEALTPQIGISNFG